MGVSYRDERMRRGWENKNVWIELMKEIGSEMMERDVIFNFSNDSHTQTHSAQVNEIISKIA